MTLKTFTWTDPLLNTDGSTVAAGEITGYEIGVGNATGVYDTKYTVTGAAAASFATDFKVPGDYFAAVRAVGPADSAWSNEATFTVLAPVPNAPTGFTVA